MFVLLPNGDLKLIPDDRDQDVVDWIERNDDPKRFIHFYADLTPPEELDA